MSKTLLVLCGVVCLVAAPQALAVTVSMHVGDSGNTSLDGNVDPSLGAPYGINPGFVIQTPGSINNLPLWGTSKFLLSTILPGGTTSADIISARFDFPDTNFIRNAADFPPQALNLVVQHFDGDSTNPASISPLDNHVDSPPLADLPGGLTQVVVIPVGGTGNSGNDKFVSTDVTDAVKADLSAGRTLSSFRVGADPGGIQAVLPGGSNYQLCDANGIGTGFCTEISPGVPNIARLTIELVPEPTAALLLGVGALGLLSRRRRA